MSKNETIFLRWFGSIAASLVIAAIIGIIGMYHASGIISVKVQTNQTKISEVRTYHEKDVELIRTSIKEMKSDQKVIMTDIKQILKEVK